MNETEVSRVLATEERFLFEAGRGRAVFFSIANFGTKGGFGKRGASTVPITCTEECGSKCLSHPDTISSVYSRVSGASSPSVSKEKSGRGDRKGSVTNRRGSGSRSRAHKSKASRRDST
eukprot:6076508-Amphidinium_carterae.1